MGTCGDLGCMEADVRLDRPEADPTVVTLTRYAEALGKTLVVSFE